MSTARLIAVTSARPVQGPQHIPEQVQLLQLVEVWAVLAHIGSWCDIQGFRR